MIDYIRELVNKLNHYTDLYNQGKPEITDEEWDKLYFELQDLETHYGIVYAASPTQSIRPDIVPELKEEILPYKMLSLAKTKSFDELNSFIGNNAYCLMPKLDGLSCELVYQNGKLQAGYTRGDGVTGSDITHCAKVIGNLPQEIPYKGELVVCGEVICRTDVFEKYFADNYANERNFASGALKLLDANESAKRKLSFVAWELCGQDSWFGTLPSKFDFLWDQGFEIVPYLTNELKIDNLKEIAKTIYHYPIDGLVVKYSDCSIYAELGETAHSPNWAMAYKFYDEAFETTLLDIEWSMGGRNGQITPVAIFEPIEFPDATVERASLHNVSIMKDTFGGMPFKGQRIKVAKMNEIIPAIVNAQNEKGEWINELKTKISPMEN